MEQNIKEVPYGISNFEQLREQNMYYVDKTMYLPLIERQPHYLFFIRPRRFGKSLFLNMLDNYYDCNKTEQFDKLFGDLWIGSHPTPLKNHYQILRLDFSHVGGTIEQVEENFNRYCNITMNSFLDAYQRFYSDKFVKAFTSTDNIGDKLALLRNEALLRHYPLYLIIDEYDNFTNTILNEQGEAVYHAITHADGFYRDVFKKFKGSFDRIFMTGVSPVTLDDVTSGFNIGWNISMKPEFNGILGFTTEDVRKMFTYYKEVGMLPADCDIDATIDSMKPWYDNYCFAKDAVETPNRVFNSDMVLYYLLNYIDSGRPPKDMVDPNTKTDYGKMKKLLQFDTMDGERKGLLVKIAEEGQIYSELHEQFSAYQIPNLDIFPSLLFYYGMLTIKGTRGMKAVLGIPNNNVRRQYYGYLFDMYEARSSVDISRLTDGFYDMAYDGKWEDCLKFMAESYENVSSVRDNIEAERNLQGFFMAYFNLQSYYITAPELELNHGYCDFFLLPDLTHYASKHSYIIELKVLPKKDWAAKAENQWQQAVEQINKYAAAPRVEALRQGTILHKIIMQFEGGKLKRMEEV